MGGTAVRDAMAGWLAGMWPDGSDGWDLLVTVTLDRRRNAGGRGATLPPQRMTLGAGVDGDRRPARTSRTRDSQGVMPVASFARRLHSVMRGIERDLRRPVTVMGGIEPHLDGWPHAHLLFKLGGGDLPMAAILIKRAFFERFGWTRVEIPRVQGDVAAYCSKYVVKSDPEAWVIYPDRGPVATQRGIRGHEDGDDVNAPAHIGADAGRPKRTRRGAREAAGPIEVADHGRRASGGRADVPGTAGGDPTRATRDGRVGAARDAGGSVGGGWGRLRRTVGIARAVGVAGRVGTVGRSGGT